jgi:hypothetical protein
MMLLPAGRQGATSLVYDGPPISTPHRATGRQIRPEEHLAIRIYNLPELPEHYTVKMFVHYI